MFYYVYALNFAKMYLPIELNHEFQKICRYSLQNVELPHCLYPCLIAFAYLWFGVFGITNWTIFSLVRCQGFLVHTITPQFYFIIYSSFWYC